jgi:type II secretory pathway component PulK
MARGSTSGGSVRNNRRGVALILVLGLLLILGGIATDIGRAARLDADIVESMRARTVARYAAESGIALGLTQLRAHRMPNVSSIALGDARFGVVALNLNARVDLAHSDTATIRGLLQQFVAPGLAATITRELAARPLQRVGELTLIPGVTDEAASAIVPYVTIWGDGSVDTSAAPGPVRAALSPAAAVVSSATRVLVIARGWQQRFPLIHEIQAVYAIDGSTPELVAWQERDL